jgi:hypothetical protein
MQVVAGKNIFLDHVVVSKLGAGNSQVYSIQKVALIFSNVREAKKRRKP